MSKHAETPGFSDAEFDAIQAAVMETDRGRQFLDEYSERVRSTDTKVLLDAIQRLEDNMVRLKAGPQDIQDELAELASAIHTTSDEICSVRNDMLEDKCAIEAGSNVFANLSKDAGSIAQALISTAEALQASALGLKETAAGSEQLASLDANVNTLFENGWRQDVLTQRISKAMSLLTHLQSALSVYHAEQPCVPQPTGPAAESELTEENRSYFAGDDDLFESDAQGVNDPVSTARQNDAASAAAAASAFFAAARSAAADVSDDEEEELVFQDTSAPTVPATPEVADDAQAVETHALAPEPGETSNEPEQQAGRDPSSSAVDSDSPVAEAEVTDEPAGAPDTAEAAGHSEATEADTAPDAGSTADVELPAIEPRVVVIRGHGSDQAAGDTASADSTTQPADSAGAAKQGEPQPASDTRSAPSAESARNSDENIDPFASAVEDTTPEKPAQATQFVFEDDEAEPEETQPEAVADDIEVQNQEPARKAFGMAEPAPEEAAIATDLSETLTSDDVVSPEAGSDAGNEAESNASSENENADETASEATVSDETDDVMEAFSDFAGTRPGGKFDIEEAPQPQMDPTEAEKERIVIIRKDSSDESSIPFADYLGIDDPVSDTDRDER